MQNFHKILFVSYGITDDKDALKQALSLARNNSATLDALIVCPDLPRQLGDYKEKYEASLVAHLHASISSARAALSINEADIPVRISLESGDVPAIRIIRHALKNANDLIIKEAEPNKGSRGFKAQDMELLRKCPCPVWLCRPIQSSRNEIKVAVAIDPESIAPEGHDLSLRLLQVARALADSCSGELGVISCWDYEYENYLKGNVWIKVTDEQLHATVLETEVGHRAALDRVIKQSNIKGALHVYHERGAADEMIPQIVQSEKFDILVMGTVARTGVYSFIIGNTAENILQQLGCSLLALKPHGFVSPVRAYD